MRYALELSPAAGDVRDALPFEARVCLDEHLQRLAEDPLVLCRRAHFPHRPVGQIYDFWCDEPPPPRFIKIFFYFGAGEEVIKVYAITAQEYGPSPGN